MFKTIYELKNIGHLFLDITDQEPIMTMSIRK